MFHIAVQECDTETSSVQAATLFKAAMKTELWNERGNEA